MQGLTSKHVCTNIHVLRVADLSWLLVETHINIGGQNVDLLFLTSCVVV